MLHTPARVYMCLCRHVPTESPGRGLIVPLHLGLLPGPSIFPGDGPTPMSTLLLMLPPMPPTPALIPLPGIPLVLLLLRAAPLVLHVLLLLRITPVVVAPLLGIAFFPRPIFGVPPGALLLLRTSMKRLIPTSY